MTERRTLTLHVGTPKSGTTSLQAILARNRSRLGDHGFLYPGTRPSHFIEVLGLRDSGFRGHRFEESPQAWADLVRDVRAHEGPALISHEILGSSGKKIIGRVVEAFPDHRIRVVITCRDLGRQLPAMWQEGVKNGDKIGYGAFLAESMEHWDGPASSRGLWRSQNLAGIADRWGRGLGADQVTLVTVPPPGSDHDLLWQRFKTAVGLPDIDYRMPAAPRNPSLGAVETELLRRLHDQLPEDLPFPVYAKQVKRRFAQRQLVRDQIGGPLTVPEAHRAATVEIATAMLDRIRRGGFPVVGDLADLEPSFREGGTDPDSVSDAVLLDRALGLLAPLVLADPGRRQPGPDAK